MGRKYATEEKAREKGHTQWMTFAIQKSRQSRVSVNAEEFCFFIPPSFSLKGGQQKTRRYDDDVERDHWAFRQQFEDSTGLFGRAERDSISRNVNRFVR